MGTTIISHPPVTIDSWYVHHYKPFPIIYGEHTNKYHGEQYTMVYNWFTQQSSGFTTIPNHGWFLVLLGKPRWLRPTAWPRDERASPPPPRQAQQLLQAQEPAT